MKIAIIDGQGGGIGKALVDRLVEEIKEAEIIAIGTNSSATLGMIKAGASAGATGENAIKVMSKEVDIIAGPLAIIVADAMMGEITSVMAESIAKSKAIKVIIPLNRCGLVVAGVQENKLNMLIEDAVNQIKKIYHQKG